MTKEIQDQILDIIQRAKNDVKLHQEHEYFDGDEDHSDIPKEFNSWHICPNCCPELFKRTEPMAFNLLMSLIGADNPYVWLQRLYLETIAMTLYYSKKGSQIDELERLFKQDPA